MQDGKKMISKEQEKIWAEEKEELKREWIEFYKNVDRNFPELKEMMRKKRASKGV